MAIKGAYYNMPKEARDDVERLALQGKGGSKVRDYLAKHYSIEDIPVVRTLNSHIKEIRKREAASAIVDIISEDERKELLRDIQSITGRFGDELKEHAKMISDLREQITFLIEENANQYVPTHVRAYTSLFKQYMELLGRMGFFRHINNKPNKVTDRIFEGKSEDDKIKQVVRAVEREKDYTDSS